MSHHLVGDLLLTRLEGGGGHFAGTRLDKRDSEA